MTAQAPRATETAQPTDASRPTDTPRPTDVAPDLLETWLRSDATVLIDVREDFEHAEERIAGAVNCPLSKFDAGAIRERFKDSRVVFHCRSGKRSTEAALRFQRGSEAVFHLAGGIEQWKSSDRAVIQPASRTVLPIMRQVQIIAGGLVTLGVVLGVTVAPAFLGLAGFVGIGLMLAGISGWCGMAKLLAAMPWNRQPQAQA